MAKDIAVNSKDLAASIRASRQRIGNSSEGVNYLKFAKGDWVIGSANELVDEDNLWAVNPVMLAHGYIAWGDGEVLGEHMVPLTAPLPPKSELDDVGASWQQCAGLHMLCIDGEFSGTNAVFKTHSKGGLQFFSDLTGEIADRIENGDEDRCVPVIGLEVDSYQHKKYGKVFVPVYRLVKWVTVEGLDEYKESAEAEAEDEAEPEPPKRQRRRRHAA